MSSLEDRLDLARETPPKPWRVGSITLTSPVLLVYKFLPPAGEFGEGGKPSGNRGHKGAHNWLLQSDELRLAW